jgi:hypothetical protein
MSDGWPIFDGMDTNFTRLLGWAATLQNFGVTALVAWVLAILTATQGLPTERRHLSPQSAVISLSQGLGYVGMPTVAALPNPLPSIAGSAAVLPPNRP